ncbi:MAG TPA: BON domain-containing protein [Candidatus Limnocylindrales bacterium]|jgi:osmotically-inducible protein OsmY|nr:BON domain-containing protein [Candidatus Limnocylindrales bacterium]
MKKAYYLALFVVAIAIAYASSQTGQSAPGGNNAGSVYGNSSPNGQTQPSSSPAQTPAGTANPSGASPATAPNASVKGSATDASGGGVAGAAGTPVEMPQNGEAGGTALMSDADLQREIQNALGKEPTLSGDSVNVAVSGENIETNGTVNTAKEKLTATRIVQSFAGNRKVVNHITVGHGSTSPASSSQESPDDHRPANSNTNPSPSNPEPNKGQPPTGSNQPPR